MNLEDLYASDVTGVPVFSTTMSQKRSKVLLNLLQFDDTRGLRRAEDKAAVIGNILEKLTLNCFITLFRRTRRWY